MSLNLFNTLTKQVEEFIPMKKDEVGFYSCGPTVYGFQHIGNYRSYVFADTLKRVLRYSGYNVTHVMNLTDVGHLTSQADTGEDKMEKAAKKEGKTAWEVAEYYTKDFWVAMDKIHNTRPDIVCKATDHIKEQIELVKILEKKGFTYKTSDGIYFNTSLLPDYGKLAGQHFDEKLSQARIEHDPEKKNQSDFALWKFSPKGEKRQMEWESPWGVGFPGWHIECSAMSTKYLGQPFDIHTGGIDHIAIHHTNEIAQSEAAYNLPLAKYWLHNEFLLVDGQKMSKSLGNVYTYVDIEKMRFDMVALRYLYLTTHYRSKMNFTGKSLSAAQNALSSLQEKVATYGESKVGCAEYEEKFLSALNNDLDTPSAIAIMWDMVKSDKPGSAKKASLLKFDEVLGLGLADIKKEQIPDDIQALAKKREDVRKAGNFSEADVIRKELLTKGYSVEDTPEGPKVKKTR